jgi:hypothetical protein
MPLIPEPKRTQRWIDGRLFYLHSYWYFRRYADDWATRLRKQGWYARVIQTDEGWKVYKSHNVRYSHGKKSGYQQYRETRGF